MAESRVVVQRRKAARVGSTFLTLLAAAAVPAAGQSVEDVGDVLQIAIPAAGALSTVALKDWQGSGQFLLSFAATQIITHGLKWAVDKERPNGNGSDAFPSGHTSAAFQGAAFIHFRYGFIYAVPAYLGAGFVGFSRVYADKHYIEDVLAGAAIAIGMTAWITDPFSSVKVEPLTTTDGAVGLQVHLAVP